MNIINLLDSKAPNVQKQSFILLSNITKSIINYK